MADRHFTHTPLTQAPPPVVCPRCQTDMALTAHGVKFELGVDVSYRRWVCPEGHQCEQQWLATT